MAGWVRHHLMSRGEVSPARSEAISQKDSSYLQERGCGSPAGVCQRPHAASLRPRALRDVGSSASQGHDTEQPLLHPGPAASLSLAPGPDTAALQATLSVEESSAFKPML